jgi:hypothetical protein
MLPVGQQVWQRAGYSLWRTAWRGSIFTKWDRTACDTAPVAHTRWGRIYVHVSINPCKDMPDTATTITVDPPTANVNISQPNAAARRKFAPPLLHSQQRMLPLLVCRAMLQATHPLAVCNGTHQPVIHYIPSRSQRELLDATHPIGWQRGTPAINKLPIQPQ